MEKKQYTFDSIDEMIEEYNNKGRERWTDEQLATARAELSIALYKISRLLGPTYYTNRADLEIKLFIREGRARKEAYKEYTEVEKMSKSMALDLSRKAINTDKEYISLWEASQEATDQLALYKEWMAQGNQVLNSMAKKT